ncbi:RidA family protein [Actinokineospora globicatena]|uniref:RidA family protein n=1 Tax=Actinokineospora globicatena TaxID=103729 RepID=UPI0020A24DCE|nr:RidA family protein [Actinokineospora globicatena]MCP2305769.1 Enamine deaminase RidA, house cleaning of reactive enamine intermediates, YjgF/YER057c/UK114 family [Actinokineospora globicatena]GLW80376.1 enamine deaminase RidA [Actinokineospora globicatena]GLW87205.1 enamine deaminase RidA [Actinokineospora globicatena]
MTPHRIVTAPDLAPPVGFAHAVVAAPGSTVHLGGQTAQDSTGAIVGSGMAAQFDQAAGNVVLALEAAGSRAEHLVSFIIYVTDVAAYKAALPELGPLWRKHFGRHYPAVALLGVTQLFDDEAMIELVATAVIPAAEGAPDDRAG